MKNNFIKTEGYPKWMYVYPSCREEDKRIVLCEITNSLYPFVFITKECESDFLKGDKISQTQLSNYGEDIPNTETVFPVDKNRTIEDGLEVNDIIIDAGDREKKVLAVLNEENRVYLLSALDDFHEASAAYTLSELINSGYKLKSQVDSDAVEMTVEEISKQLGKNVKIVKG